MPVSYEVRLFAVNKKGFDKDGVRVEYNENIFLNEEDGKRFVLVLNSKKDYSSMMDELGTLNMEIDTTGKNKPRLVSFEAVDN